MTRRKRQTAKAPDLPVGLTDSAENRNGREYHSIRSKISCNGETIASISCSYGYGMTRKAAIQNIKERRAALLAKYGLKSDLPPPLYETHTIDKNGNYHEYIACSFYDGRKNVKKFTANYGDIRSRDEAVSIVLKKMKKYERQNRCENR